MINHPQSIGIPTFRRQFPRNFAASIKWSERELELLGTMWRRIASAKPGCRLAWRLQTTATSPVASSRLSAPPAWK
ncbi:MAG: hypothetical protein K9N23_10245 [Akkermansiaceae bacterium]|nr:hypothetical protein [Akkermansiaceae bacterium]